MVALHLMLVRIVRCFQNTDMKSLSLSETMSEGRPFSQYHLSKNKTASSLAVRVEEVGMMQMSEARQSVIVRIEPWPWSNGRGLMKSIEIDWQHSSGIGSG